ncbi:MAG TPA: MMPL family transporter [Gemmatimonadales bacterium]|nr:MMPL family transporter [Gemmatimonadales bacterium]
MRFDGVTWMVRQRGWVAAGWVGAGLVLLPRAAQVERLLAVAPPAGPSEAALVDATLATRFESPYVNYAVLVIGGAPPPTDPAGRALLDTLRARIALVPGVLRVRSWEGPADTLFSSARAGFLVVGLDGARHVPEDVVPLLRATTEALVPRLANTYPALTLRWTGRAALNADLRHASSADVSAAERRALPITLVLLILAFGTVTAAIVPLVSGALVIVIALGLATIVSLRWPLATLVQSFITMIGLGLGIDYALLVVSRFRESLATGRSGGRTVLLSGAAVAVGFASLLTVTHPELRAAAVGGLLATVAAVALSVSFVPAVLAALGGSINRGWLIRRRWAPDSSARWRAWAARVTRRPVVVLFLTGVPVVLLAWQARRLHPGLPRGEWLPARLESSVALHDLQAAGRSGVVQTINVLVSLPPGHGVLTREGWTTLRGVRARLLEDRRVAAVYSLGSLDRDRPPSHLALFTTPRAAWRPFLTEDFRVALLEAVPTEAADAVELVGLVEQLRALDPMQLSGVPGTRLLVGGLPASRADYLHAVNGQFARVATLVLLGTLVALFLGFRSVMVPLKAVVLNLLAVGAGFGALVLIFQDGHGLGLFGVAEPIDQVFPVLPTIVFCTVFGLSMDYEVFLVARVAEGARRGEAPVRAITEGLAHAGPVITSAAAIMIAVFGAFALGDFLLIKMLGVALAVAVFTDATLVRGAIAPALLTLAGRWNWWPGR